MTTGKYRRIPAEVQKLKAWLYDQEIPRARLDRAWTNALEAGSSTITAFNRSGMQVLDLPKHLLVQLLEKYGDHSEPQADEPRDS